MLPRDEVIYKNGQISAKHKESGTANKAHNAAKGNAASDNMSNFFITAASLSFGDSWKQLNRNGINEG